jgi:hypothetical protein
LRRRGDSSPGQSYADIVASGGASIEARASSARDPEAARRFSMHSFGSVFMEVAVDPDLGMVRVRRVVGAYGAGRIVKPRLEMSHNCATSRLGIYRPATRLDRVRRIGTPLPGSACATTVVLARKARVASTRRRRPLASPLGTLQRKRTCPFAMAASF